MGGEEEKKDETGRFKDYVLAECLPTEDVPNDLAGCRSLEIGQFASKVAEQICLLYFLLGFRVHLTYSDKWELWRISLSYCSSLTRYLLIFKTVAL